MASPKAFPRTVVDLVDQDYGHKLSAEEKAWLAQFNDEFYGAAFTDDSFHGEAGRRELYLTKNHRNEDVYGRCLRVGGGGEGFNGANGDVEGEGGYLDPREVLEGQGGAGSEAAGHCNGGLADGVVADGGMDVEVVRGTEAAQYKEALNEFRATLPINLKQKTVVTPEYRAAKQKLEELTGTKTSIDGENTPMAQNRLERLKAAHEVIMNLGRTVCVHQFTGAESEAAVAMLTWLDGYRTKLEAKLVTLGWSPPATPSAGGK